MRTTVAVVIIVLMLVVLSTVDDAVVAAQETTFESAECPISPPEGIDEARLDCGYLTVPEDRARPNGAQVTLAVAVIKASNAGSEREPLLYLSGGPGGPSLQSEMYGFGAAAVADAFQDRDIVFYDQRGTGLSTPSLFCDELTDFTLEVLKQGWSVEEASEQSDVRLLACRDRLTAEGVDLRQYSSAISADDIADLMTELGHDSFNIYGVSYGTKLALTVMRDHPERVRSAVIDSVVPLQVEGALADGQTFMRSIGELADGCAADVECNAAYPDLEQTLWDLVATANAEPFAITIEDAAGNPVNIRINGDAILQGAFTAFYSTELIPLLPFAAYEIAAGNTALLTALAQQVVFAFSGSAVGMSTSVNCNEETPFYTPEKLTTALQGVRPEVIAAGIGITTPAALASELAMCDEWGTDNPPAVENQAVVSDIPTLAFGGQYDPVTPPQWGDLAAETLSTSYVFEFPATGHGVITDRPSCATSIVNQFLLDPAEAPDGRCVGEIPPPDFQVAATSAPAPVPTATAPAGVITAPDTGRGPSDTRSGELALAILVTVLGAGVGLAGAGGVLKKR